ncbi:MAG: hypothetical protein N2560_02180 [Ignavibacteria bacterium]|nr:hypothetical protein [Ignavibacteria bacterium]
MKKYHHFFIIFLSVFPLLLLLSCSDSSTNNSEPSKKTYFPTSVGSFWKYLQYEIDSLGVKVPNTEDTITSTIVSNQMILGKNASIFLSKSSKNQTTDTLIYAYENDKVYSFLSLFDNEFIPIGEGKQWILLADFNSPQWTILSDTTLDTLDFQDFAKMIPTISVKGKKGNKSDLAIKNKAVPSQEIILTISFKIKMLLPNVPLPVNLNFDVVQHYWFGEGIGIVKERLDPFKFSVLVMEQSFNGNQSDLIDYNIK